LGKGARTRSEKRRTPRACRGGVCIDAHEVVFDRDRDRGTLCPQNDFFGGISFGVVIRKQKVRYDLPTGITTSRTKKDVDLDLARRLLAEGVPKTAIARRLKIAKTTLYHRLNELKPSREKR
jgi:hypothetical protein